MNMDDPSLWAFKLPQPNPGEAAAAMAAIWVATFLIPKLADRAASYFDSGDASAGRLHELRALTVPKIESMIESVDRKPSISRAFRSCGPDLKAAALEVEDALDEYEYELLKEEAEKRNHTHREDGDQVSALSSSLLGLAECTKLIARKAKGALLPSVPKTKLAKSVEKLIKVADRMVRMVKDTELVESKINPFVFGRDEEFARIKDLLIQQGLCDEPESSSRKVPIIALYGMGGIGKTTLAQRIYDNDEVIGYFGLRMWIDVSSTIDALAVTRRLIESVTGAECPRLTGLHQLHEILREQLKSKKFLLVLDDLWCNNWEMARVDKWRNLLNILSVGMKGSVTLVTTRTKMVESVLGTRHLITLEELKFEHCWSIVRHYARFDRGESISDRAELETVAKQITSKLNNSPLAARMVGERLGTTPFNDWKSILEGGDLLKESKYFLVSSYKRLSVPMQRCFAFCGVFPKGWEFEIDYLVSLWVAESYIQPQSVDDLMREDIGRLYFDRLLADSFFQPCSDYNYPDKYVLHDIFHNLAEEVSKGNCYRIESDNQLVELPAMVLHLFVGAEKLSSNLPTISKLVSLRTLIIKGILDVSHVHNFSSELTSMFRKLERLRVLVLSCELGIEELPSSICQLKHLHYLDLQGSGIKKLPKSFFELYNLQSLNLIGCHLESLPVGLNNLIGLRHLIADPTLICSISEIGKLTSLQNLKEYRVQKETGYGIGQLKNMNDLRGSLHIKNLENVKGKQEGTEAMLGSKEFLNRLVLHWSWFPERDGRSDEEAMEALEPSRYLKELKILNYNGFLYPSWMAGNQCLSNLQSLHLIECKNLKLQDLRPPPNLKELVIGGDTGVKFPSWMSEDPFFSHLECLAVTSCNNWQVLPPLGQQLRELKIIDCPELKCGGEGLQSLTSLESLTVWGCPKLLLPYAHDQPAATLSAEDLRIPYVKEWVTIDDPILLGVLLQKQALASLQKLEISSYRKDVSAFTPEQEEVLLQLTSLSEIHFCLCPNLRSLPDNLERLSSLKMLVIEDCPKMESLPDRLPTSLEQLSIYGCHQQLYMQYGKRGPQRHKIHHIPRICFG